MATKVCCRCKVEPGDSNGYCSECNREYRREWQQKNPEKSRRRAREYARKKRAELGPEEVKRRQRQYYQARDRFQVALYGTNRRSRQRGHAECSNSRDEIAKRFTGFCHACGVEEGERRLHLDHDHATGDFRGWLCLHCNTALGSLQDDPQQIKNLLKYLTFED